MVMGQCLKCGKTTDVSSVFCAECIAVMDQYPIKPGTKAHVLPRPKQPEYKVPESYREAANRAQLQQAKRSIRWLMALAVLLLALLLLSTWMLIRSLDESQEVPPIGRNYTTTQK